MSEMSDPTTTASPRGTALSSRPANRWFRRFDLGVAGFMMSLGLTMAGLYSDARGADIAARPLDQMIVYRDGEGDRSVLTAVFKLVLVNAADTSYGDMLMKADLEIDGLRFAMNGTVQPNFTADPEVASKCPLDSRCIVRPGLVAVEKPDEVLDIPGGSHLLTSIAFPLVPWNCSGTAARCARFASPAAQQALFSGRSAPRLRLHFYADGERLLRCGLAPLDLAYLQKVGWTAVACEDASVSGGPLI